MTTTLHANKTLLNMIHFAVAEEIKHSELWDSVSPELAVIDTARGLVLQLTAGILGRQSRQIYRYPATWWDAFKIRWFRGWLAWALRRWPARFVEFSCGTTELFPDIKPVPGQRSIVIRTIEPVRVLS